MSDRRVALLRGINVGTAKRVAMADLRSLFDDLGYRDVRTLLNSGNVVFGGAKGCAGDEGLHLEAAIERRVGFAARVTVLTAREVAAAVRKNPLAKVADDPSRLLITVVKDRKVAAHLKPLLAEDWSPEELAIEGRFAYLWCANGIAGSRLWTAVGRVLKEDGTARNLATMEKLLVLVETGSEPR